MKKEEKNIINETFKYIEDIFKEDNGGHDYYHSYRVYRVATTIAKKEKADLFIVGMSSLLHDIDDYKLFGGEMGSTKRAHDWLEKQSVSEDKIEEICSIIKNMSYKGRDTLIGESLEERIVQDADRLDAIGAIGIARAFTVGATMNATMYDPNLIPKDNISAEEYIRMNKEKGTTAINHFYEKLLKLKDYISTDTGKKMAIKRHKYMEDFLDEFFKEIEGKS